MPATHTITGLTGTNTEHEQGCEWWNTVELAYDHCTGRTTVTWDCDCEVEPVREFTQCSVEQVCASLGLTCEKLSR